MNSRHLFCLPWPPSLNHQKENRWAKVRHGPKAGKRYMAQMLTEEAKAYKQRVFYEVRLGHQVPPRLTGRLDIMLLACPPDTSRMRDLDNYWKLLLDSLKYAGAITDDSLFDHEEIFRGNPVEGGRILVSIGRFDPDAAGPSLNRVGLPWPRPQLTTHGMIDDAAALVDAHGCSVTASDLLDCKRVVPDVPVCGGDR